MLFRSETVIVSGDKDFLQLVRPGVRILNPWHGRPGRTTEKWYDTENAAERLGVPAERVTDYLALLGDTSDNVPGVKGIGEKTAHALIERWGTVEAMLDHVAEVTPTRAQTALREHGADGILSKELVTIRQDLPMELDLDALAVREPDWARLRDLFVALEFRTHAQDAAARVDTEQVAAPTTAYETIDTLDGVARVVALARTAGTIAIDTETVLDPDAPPVINAMRARLVGLSIATAPGVAFYLPFRHQAAGGGQGGLGLGDAPVVDAAAPRNLPEPLDPALEIGRAHV